jgi:hypothetical protein
VGQFFQLTHCPEVMHIETTYDEGSDDYTSHFRQPHDFVEPERQEDATPCSVFWPTLRFEVIAEVKAASTPHNRFKTWKRRSWPAS